MVYFEKHIWSLHDRKFFRRKTFWLAVKTISPFQVKWSVPKMIRYLDVAIMEMRGLDHCKTWFNRPFPLDIPYYYQYQLQLFQLFLLSSLDFVCIVDYPILSVLWTILFCLYCGLSYFD